MTVWVVHEVRDDLSPAASFGQLRYINHRYINGDELEQSGSDWTLTLPAAFDRHIRDAALEFKASTDYLLIAGDHLQLLAFMAALLVWNNSVCVLRYDRRLNEYIPIWVHSSIVPAPAPVLESDADIGNDEHGKSRTAEDLTRGLEDIISVAVEAPLSRRDPRSRRFGP